MVVAAFEEIAPDHRLTEENFLLSIYLGWCLEVYHATVLMLDDIMDGSKTRRGQACWYIHPDVRFRAINDAVILDAAIYNFLHKHFNSLQCYGRIIETFHKNAFLLNMGQFMDLSAEQQDAMTFTMDQFRKTVIHKTAHHSFYVPIELAYNLAEQTDMQTLHAAREILYEMGIFFQIQDDFLDCYGDPKVTGKIGTDIEDGKCTWLIVTFLNRANSAQKDILKESYGKEDAESVAMVKQLYNQVGLPDAYKNYEEETYKRIKKDIQEAEGIPKKICHRLMDKLYGRKV
uniref:Farnesyl pyrophosphate synthase n=1 Tax=Lutzomyia longipalpis TaxID=7200 RepID=A0A1B0CKL7_LUTLO